MYPFYYVGYRGKNVRQVMDFKRNVVRMSPAEYAEFYKSINSISRNRATDLNRKCLNTILSGLAEFRSGRVLDVGCGTRGFLLSKIGELYPEMQTVGLDILAPDPGLTLQCCQGSIDDLPFADKSFDVVIATHVLEHCLDLAMVVRELKRVCKSELIIVVPKQRSFFYTIDEHLQFFFYEEQLVSALGLRSYECRNLSGDWLYRGRVRTDY